MEQIIKDLKTQKSFYEFLVYVRDTEGLELIIDHNWSWLEYHGKEVEGSQKERFTRTSEMNDLLSLAGL